MPQQVIRYGLSVADFDSVIAGGGTASTLRRIREGERSHRLLQFDLLIDLLHERPAAVGPLPPADTAWHLLLDAERRDRTGVGELLLAPETGLWLAATLRRLGGSASGEAPLWADAGQFHALAVAAAVRAGLDFTLTVPARHGTVWLPSLGRAVTPDTVRPWGTARVTCVQGELTVRIGGRTIRVPPPYDGETAHWQPARGIAVTVQGMSATVLLDDLGTHRIDPAATGRPPPRLPEPEARAWETLLRDALALIEETDPQSATDAAVLLRGIEPLPTPATARPVSATSGDAVGRFASTVPPDAVQLAAVLAHEIQHSKLGALMHLYSLYEPGDTSLCYAPWRDDPRPIRGLLQGVYAFTGVARFWRGRALHPDTGGAEADAAHFEYGLWRRQLLRVLPELRTHAGLTGLGRRTVQRLSETVLGWGRPDRTRGAYAMAEDAADQHAAEWRLYHAVPDRAVVDALTRSWPRRLDPPSRTAPARVLPSPRVPRLDTLASLYRVRLRDERALERAGDGPGELAALVPGARVTELLHALGDSEGAAKLAATALQTREPDADWLWADLLLALRATGHEAAGPVLERPELARAVYQELARAEGNAPDPVAFVGWLNDQLGRLDTSVPGGPD
ncbi:HEXXH motif domain-containing protein [Streptomyces sp. NPDC006997]|uniref:HEXXH motif domain-containing protein n=1 Tax=Streptomyces sp. NPDC006997 TaxID=3155356 RepID=UPI0033F0B0EE